jgi:hypothetical protein
MRETAWRHPFAGEVPIVFQRLPSRGGVEQLYGCDNPFRLALRKVSRCLGSGGAKYGLALLVRAQPELTALRARERNADELLVLVEAREDARQARDHVGLGRRKAHNADAGVGG